ncbi:MAG: SIMPL domain-containing protein [Spirochaetaceae bacterium]|jgi:uncharacterized protein YggE|nr:SIMPL domain-containing protein [Spirochaetaceae bacterium]
MKALKTAAAAALCICCITLSLSAETLKNTITVTGSGAVSVTPDVATINLAVITRSADVTEAVSQNSDLMLRVQSVIQTINITKDEFSTSDYSIYQEYSYKDGIQIPGEYRVSNNLIIRVRNIDDVGMVIDAAVTAGANQLNSVSFSASNTAEAVTEARKLAVEQAYRNARILADAAGRKIGKALIIQEQGYPQQPAYRTANVMLMEDAGGSTPINPGKTDVTVSVSVVYELK